MLFRRQAIMVYSEFRSSHPQYMANTQQDVVNISSIFAYDVSGALLPIFFVQKGEKFSTFSTVKTVESTVKTVEWLIISTDFSTETLKNRLIPHEN